MDLSTKNTLIQLNPWLNDKQDSFLSDFPYIARYVDPVLLEAELDDLCLVLTGPRRAGKTTLALRLSEHLVLKTRRFDQLLYLNCDYQVIRSALDDVHFISEVFELFGLERPVVLIDEVQRLTNPGLLLKSLVDLHLPIKLIATGSSQLELRSRVQESLTGRHLETVILPLSIVEGEVDWDKRMIFGSYPRILLSQYEQTLLGQLFSDYIQKDIINFLKIRNSDVIEKLLVLLAHSSGQLVNYSQLAIDCGVSQPTVKEYLNLLEQTFVISKLTPFVGNRRTEITRNPVYYFIDNGFRNQALGNFLALDRRTDMSLLAKSFVYQELYKYLKPHISYKIHYWRTKSGAEVDFVVTNPVSSPIPIEVKYRRMTEPAISRSFRSFIDAYHPDKAFIVTRSLIATKIVEDCEVFFIPLQELKNMLSAIVSDSRFSF